MSRQKILIVSSEITRNFGFQGVPENTMFFLAKLFATLALAEESKTEGSNPASIRHFKNLHHAYKTDLLKG